MEGLPASGYLHQKKEQLLSETCLVGLLTLKALLGVTQNHEFLCT